MPQTEVSSSAKSIILSESIHDYQNSDIYPSEECNNQTRRYSVLVSCKKRSRSKRRLKRRIEPYFMNDASSESSNITSPRVFIPIVDCGVNSTTTNDVHEITMSHNVIKGSNETYIIPNHIHNSSQANTFTTNLSNITLPPSPEISSVENLSTDHTLKTNKSCQKYTISDVDVSMPLMEQDCWIKRRVIRSASEMNTLYQPKELPSANGTDSMVNPNVQQKSALSETLLNKVAKVNLVENTMLGESLNKKLHDLESAKKIKSGRSTNSSETVMDKGKSVFNANITKAKKKVEAKKRSSTPLKRKSTRKSYPTDIEPIIEDNMEFGLQNSRNLQPPSPKSMQHKNVNEIFKKRIDCNKSKNKLKAGARSPNVRQKNIIKVKILRPKRKSLKAKNKSIMNLSKANSYSTSDKDMLQDSHDLTHNHSESCLLDDEQGKVPLRSNTASATFARDTYLKSSPTKFNIRSANTDTTVFKPNLLNTDANRSLPPTNRSRLNDANDASNNLSTVPPIYSSYESLITNDLSHETSPQSQSRNSMWSLLTEDESTKTNTNPPQSPPVFIPPEVARLFPITCAVPNLSTITEASKEPEEIQKHENGKC